MHLLWDIPKRNSTLDMGRKEHIDIRVKTRTLVLDGEKQDTRDEKHTWEPEQ